MSYSRRQLEALGEMLGESVTRKEGGRIIYGGGGSSSPPSQQTQTQVVDLPDWAKPTAERTLAKTEALTTDRPFRSFAGQYDQAGNQIGFDASKVVAGFQPMQREAFRQAGQLQPSAAAGMGMGLAGAAGMRALGTRYNPYQTGQFGEQAGEYMSPFIQQALEPQMREARRQSEIQRNMDQAQAVSRGAFGGSRQAIVEAERQRNLGTQLGDIQSRGLQSAFDQARQQFNTEQQLREQSRQYGAGLGMQGLQTALSGAGQLGQLGGQQFGQQRDIIGLQSQLGSQQQQLEQARLSAAQQDFAAAQRYPYQQLEFMSNILRGTPMGSVQSMYQAQPSMANQLLGAGTSLAGAYMMGGGRFAEGGLASAYAEGGSVTDDRKVESIISKLSDAQLQQARQMAMARRDADQIQLIDRELAERAAMRAAQPAAGIDALPADNMDFADGGIVAFADGGDVERYNGQAGSLTGEVQRILRKAPHERTPEENAILVQAGQIVQSRTLGSDSGVASANTFLQNLGPSIRNYFTAGASRLSDEELAARPNAGGVMNERILRGLGVSPSAALTSPQASYSNEGRRTPVSPAAATATTPAAPAAPRADAGLGGTPEAAAARKAATPGAGAAAAPKLDLDPGKMFTDELAKLRAETRPEREMIEGLNKAREDAAKAEKADLQALNEKFADALKGRRERLDTREAALGNMKNQYAGLALLEAGAAMMTTRGNVGQAAGAGVERFSQQYAAGMDKLNAAKDKLADARDRLDDLQLNRDEMSAREIFKAESKIRDTALAGREALINHIRERDKVDRETAIKTVDQLMQVGLTQFKEASATQRANIGANATITAAGMRGAGGPAGEDKQTLNELKALQGSLQNQLKTEFNKDQRAAINAQLAQVNAAIAKMAGLSTMGAAPGAPSPGGTMSGWGKASVVNP